MTNKELFVREEQEIRNRRENAGFTPEDKGNFQVDQACETDGRTSTKPRCWVPQLLLKDKVGIALSGGGVRTAAFNLGLLQSLHRSGILRLVDYLSTVSGGSYVGAALVHSVTKRHSFAQEDFDLGVDKNGQPKELAEELSRKGNYLFRLDLIANRYFAGFFFNLIPRVALLIAIGAGIAFLWRCLDLHWIRDHLKGLGLDTDWFAAILPAVIMFATWLFFCILAVSLKSQPLKVWSNRLFWTWNLFLLVGFAVLIGNGNINLKQPLSTDLTANTISWQQSFRWPLILMTAAGLLPALFPRQLIQSGVAPRNYVESWVFYYTSFVLFLGIPLLAVGYLAQENVSGFATYRDAQFVGGDFRSPSNFLLDVGRPRTDLQAAIKAVVPVQLGKSLESEDWYRQLESSSLGQTAPSIHVKTPTHTLSGTLNLSLLQGDPNLPERCRNYLKILNELNTNDLKLRADWGSRTFELGERSNALYPEWIHWRYLTWFPRALWSAQFLAQSPNTYCAYVKNLGELREIERQILADLNKHMKNQSLFSWKTTNSNPSPVDEKFASAELIDLSRQMSATGNLPDERRRGQLHRQLLEAIYPKAFAKTSDILRRAVIHHDQIHRAIIFGVALAVFLMSARFINPNATTLHDFYRDRLAVGFLGVDKTEADHPYPKIPSVNLSDCDPHGFGAPYPLIHAAVCEDHRFWRHPTQLEASFAPFLLSPIMCGSERWGFTETKRYADGTLTLADAMAISGAALSPNFFVHHIVMTLMETLNLRMGKWLPNFGMRQDLPADPNMLRLYWDELWHAPKQCRFSLVTDGGHYENLGLEALLDRRCRFIIASDAGCDPLLGYDDLSRLLRRYEASTGVQFIELDCDEHLKVAGKLPCRAQPVAGKSHDAQKVVDALPGEEPDRKPTQHFFAARIKYPESCYHDLPAILIYIKPSLTGDEDIVIRNYAIHHAEFPHESTSDQAFSHAQFEAYRRLGFHIGEQMAEGMQDLNLDRKGPFDPAAFFFRLVSRCEPGFAANDAAPEKSPVMDSTESPDGGSGAGAGPQPAPEVGPTSRSGRYPEKRKAGRSREKEEAIRNRVAELIQAVRDGLDSDVPSPTQAGKNALLELEKMGEETAPAADLLIEALLGKRNLFQASVYELLDKWGDQGVFYLTRILKTKSQSRLWRESLLFLKEYVNRYEIDIRPSLDRVCEIALQPKHRLSRRAVVQLLEAVGDTYRDWKPRCLETLQLMQKTLSKGDATLAQEIRMALTRLDR